MVEEDDYVVVVLIGMLFVFTVVIIPGVLLLSAAVAIGVISFLRRRNRMMRSSKITIMNQEEGATMAKPYILNGHSLPNIAETIDEFNLGAKSLSPSKKSETERDILND